MSSIEIVMLVLFCLLLFMIIYKIRAVISENKRKKQNAINKKMLDMVIEGDLMPNLDKEELEKLREKFNKD